MSEKKVEETATGEQDVDYGVGHVQEARPRKHSGATPATLVAEEIFDERYETTHRGLKSRYVAWQPPNQFNEKEF